MQGVEKGRRQDEELTMNKITRHIAAATPGLSLPHGRRRITSAGIRRDGLRP